MRILWVFSVVVTAACVPTAKYHPASTSTLNAPSDPRPGKTAKDLLTSKPAVVATEQPLNPGSDERIVDGGWRWAGTEYRYVSARCEKQHASYVWDRP